MNKDKVMSGLTANSDKRNGHSLGAILTFALFIGLLLSLLDVLAMSLFEVPGVTVFCRVMEPVALKIIMIVLLYGALWFLFVYPLSRVFKLRQKALRISLGIFIALVYESYTLYGYEIFSWGSLVHNVLVLLIIGGWFLTVLIFSWAGYSIAKLIINSKWCTVITAVCLTAPLLLAETITAMWVNKLLRQPPRFFTLPVLTANIVYLIAVIFTLAVFLYFRRSKATVKILQVFAVLVFLASGVIFVLGSDRPLASEANVRTGHPVKRVILIIVDTLRADALSCYGGRRIDTPCIDRLAADGIFFEKAFAPSPWTTPSMASILAGLSPFVHMATDYQSILPGSLPTLAERMYDDGYLTHAIGKNPMLVRSNFSQGFIGYNFFPKRPDFSPCGRILSRFFPKRFASSVETSDLTQLAIEWLDSNYDKDFFLWLHYFDPHVPYKPPLEYLSGRQPPAGMRTSFATEGANRSVRDGTLKLNPEQREWVRTLYDCEVIYVDRNVGMLLDHLKELNLYDDTLIILTSDHGEEFWEHGGIDHGHTLYNELLWVPMIIKLPAPYLKTAVPQKVSNGQIVPTVFELCGIDYKRDYLSYDSLVPAWSASSKVDAEVPIVCTGLLYYEEKESVIFDGYKYIHSLFTGRQEFYDLTEDPAERFNIEHLSETKVGNAKQILTENDKETRRLKKIYSLEGAQKQEVDADTMRQLKSLGYVQ